MRSTSFEQLTHTAAEVILEQLPERIKQALLDRANERTIPWKR